MNQFIQRSLTLLFLMLGMGSQVAMGVVITQGTYLGTDVGSVDLFIAEAQQQGNPTSETAWVNSVLGVSDITFATKTETVDYFATDEANVFAFDLQSALSGYFIIKNATRVALFQNLASLDWGVFDASELSGVMNLPSEEFTISHVTELNGRVNVPEPSTLVLLGLGLIGIYVARRDRTQGAMS